MKLSILLVAASGTASLAGSCNPEEAQRPFEGEALSVSNGVAVPPTFLPQDKGSESPACLDGSPYGFYFVPSTTGSTKWTINLEGGGWCYDEINCYCRSKGSLGSSTKLPATMGCGCMNPHEDGSIDTNCNCIFMPYSDGASFAGYRAEPWPVPEDKASGVPAGATVTFRGIKNFDGVIDFALKKGMSKAKEFVLTGGSAGGLSTFLHADRVLHRLEQYPYVPQQMIRAAPVVGYFLDHDNFKHTDGGKPNTAAWATPGTGANYTFWMKYVYSMQNLSFGADGGLMAACGSRHHDEPHLCFMSPHMQDVMQTPFFMFNSKYDAWQLGNEFQAPFGLDATDAERDGVLQYGKDFMAQLAPIDGTKHGAMITSCICHGCPWADLKLDGKSSFEHYADWYYGKTQGSASIHVDTRLPNGNGTLAGGPFKGCTPFRNGDSDAGSIVTVV